MIKTAATLGAMILVAACGPTAATSTGPARTTLTVFAAASLQPAFDNIGQKLQGTNNIVRTWRKWPPSSRGA